MKYNKKLSLVLQDCCFLENWKTGLCANLSLV